MKQTNCLNEEFRDIYLSLDSDLTTKWLNRLRVTATTNDAKDKLGQISAILEYFNKQSTNHGLAVTLSKLNFSLAN